MSASKVALMTSKHEPWGQFGLVEVLSAADLADRWERTPATIVSYWRTGRIPAPINPDATRRFRWRLADIEAFEAGQKKVAS